MMDLRYWTIINQRDQELLGIMGGDRSGTLQELIAAVNQKLGSTWRWGPNINQVEFETYQAFGIEEIRYER